MSKYQNINATASDNFLFCLIVLKNYTQRKEYNRGFFLLLVQSYLNELGIQETKKIYLTNLEI